MILDPSHSNALTKLDFFINNGLKNYSVKRNHDLGVEDRSNVSNLSPYIKKRIIHEKKVVSSCLNKFSYESIEKFIQEVFWRTYWKGWLEGRPSVWFNYLKDLDKIQNNLKESNYFKDYEKAINGRTGIDCFDSWVIELKKFGYLHNHTRMWFASIWIFTLNLPWQLGANFFYNNLLDADAASNTLSWRWVAGLQTKGKIYLAREENIEKYSKFSFSNRNFFKKTIKEPKFTFHEYEELKLYNKEISNIDFYLINPNYLLYEKCVLKDLQNSNVIYYNLTNNSNDSAAKHKFNLSAVNHYIKWLKKNSVEVKEILDEKELKLTVSENLLSTPYPSIGYENDKLIEISKSQNISINYLYDSFDILCWPYAKSGFFKFKTKINYFIEKFFDYQS